MSPCTRLIKRMLLRSENESKNSLITELTFCVCLDLLEADIMERREYAEERRQMIRAFKASVRLEREAGRSDAASFGGITIALLYRVGGGVCYVAWYCLIKCVFRKGIHFWGERCIFYSGYRTARYTPFPKTNVYAFPEDTGVCMSLGKAHINIYALPKNIRTSR